MKFAIIGATHGNEPTGIEVINALHEIDLTELTHEFQTFIGNPKALVLQRRFVDCDLNRCFGVFGKAAGYEAERAKQLTEQIAGQYDFLLDIHSTTSNMGLTLILTKTDQTSRQAAAYLQQHMPQIILIESTATDEQCCYTNAMAPSGLTIEVGPVANNVIRADLVFSVYQMLELLLRWNFAQTVDTTQLVYYKSFQEIYYPKGDAVFYIHPDIDGQDFKALPPQSPLFINMKQQTLNYEGDEIVYPLFINEAAYQNNRLAMLLSRKMTGFSD